jgi:RecJ-like exonuclease
MNCRYCHGSGRNRAQYAPVYDCPDCGGAGRVCVCRGCGETFRMSSMEARDGWHLTTDSVVNHRTGDIEPVPAQCGPIEATRGGDDGGNEG